jgi:hypothetical protein
MGFDDLILDIFCDESLYTIEDFSQKKIRKITCRSEIVGKQICALRTEGAVIECGIRYFFRGMASVSESVEKEFLF